MKHFGGNCAFMAGVFVCLAILALGTAALEAFRNSVPSRGQAFVHHEPRKLQPEPFR
jgi:hypothetical protein